MSWVQDVLAILENVISVSLKGEEAMIMILILQLMIVKQLRWREVS